MIEPIPDLRHRLSALLEELVLLRQTLLRLERRLRPRVHPARRRAKPEDRDGRTR